jgi:hypothetical protein
MLKDEVLLKDDCEYRPEQKSFKRLRRPEHLTTLLYSITGLRQLLQLAGFKGQHIKLGATINSETSSHW